MVNHKALSSQGNVTCEIISKYKDDGENIYVLLSAINDKLPNTCLAVVTSNNVIDLKSDSGAVISLRGHTKRITGLKFSNEDPSLLLSSSLDGYLCIWDVRCGGNPVQMFSEESDGVVKPLTCFDFNLDERLVCAGTEAIREDSFLLFWDRRSSKSLGGYWNCHTDEITDVQFHPVKDAGMASSSVDGLINIFDLNGTCEDEALLTTLNVGCCVNKFLWKDHFVSCLKSIEAYELWSTNKVNPLISAPREYLSNQLKDYKCKADYLIDTFIIGDLFYLATGSHEGFVHLWKIENQKVELSGMLSNVNGHSQIVRTICYSDRAKTIISGGEDGLVCKWTGVFT